jgi:tRNA1Val (adenine37-N6)-methyltransferase
MAVFQFKQFAVAQDRCAMKINTDGVLLAAWAKIAAARKILDIGTGTGVLALMAAQRCPNAQIIAVEIEPNAAEQAQENIDLSPFGQQIELRQQAIQEFASIEAQQHSFDAIICNPPFFDADKHLLPDENNYARQIALANLTLSFAELLQATALLLKPTGKAFFVIPQQQKNDFFDHAIAAKLYLAHDCSVAPHADKPANRLLLTLQPQLAPPQYSDIIIANTDSNEDGSRSYTDQYRQLLEPFLTIF